MTSFTGNLFAANISHELEELSRVNEGLQMEHANQNTQLMEQKDAIIQKDQEIQKLKKHLLEAICSRDLLNEHLKTNREERVGSRAQQFLREFRQKQRKSISKQLRNCHQSVPI